MAREVARWCAEVVSTGMQVFLVPRAAPPALSLADLRPPICVDVVERVAVEAVVVDLDDLDEIGDVRSTLDRLHGRQGWR